MAAMTRNAEPNSSNVLPTSPCNDGDDVGSLYAEFDGEVLLKNAAFAPTPTNLDYLSLRQLGRCVSLAGKLPTLRDLIVRVIAPRSKKQVIRANARWDVAMVENAKTVGDRAIRKFPRNAVRSVVRTVGRAEVSVPSLIAGARPEPTRFGLIDLGPKTNFQISKGAHVSSGVAARLRAEVMCGAIHSADAAKEFNAACLADRELRGCVSPFAVESDTTASARSGAVAMRALQLARVALGRVAANFTNKGDESTGGILGLHLMTSNTGLRVSRLGSLITRRGIPLPELYPIGGVFWA